MERLRSYADLGFTVPILMVQQVMTAEKQLSETYKKVRERLAADVILKQTGFGRDAAVNARLIQT